MIKNQKSDRTLKSLSSRGRSKLFKLSGSRYGSKPKPSYDDLSSQLFAANEENKILLNFIKVQLKFIDPLKEAKKVSYRKFSQTKLDIAI